MKINLFDPLTTTRLIDHAKSSAFFDSLSLSLSLSLSFHPSLSFIALGRSSKLHPVSAQIWWLQVFAGHLTLVCLYSSPRENVASEFVLTSPAVSSIYCSSYLNDLCNRRKVTVQLIWHFIYIIILLVHADITLIHIPPPHLQLSGIFFHLLPHSIGIFLNIEA